MVRTTGRAATRGAGGGIGELPARGAGPRASPRPAAPRRGGTRSVRDLAAGPARARRRSSTPCSCSSARMRSPRADGAQPAGRAEGVHAARAPGGWRRGRRSRPRTGPRPACRGSGAPRRRCRGCGCRRGRCAGSGRAAPRAPWRAVRSDGGHRLDRLAQVACGPGPLHARHLHGEGRGAGDAAGRRAGSASAARATASGSTPGVEPEAAVLDREGGRRHPRRQRLERPVAELGVPPVAPARRGSAPCRSRSSSGRRRRLEARPGKAERHDATTATATSAARTGSRELARSEVESRESRASPRHPRSRAALPGGARCELSTRDSRLSTPRLDLSARWPRPRPARRRRGRQWRRRTSSRPAPAAGRSAPATVARVRKAKS